MTSNFTSHLILNINVSLSAAPKLLGQQADVTAM